MGMCLDFKKWIGHARIIYILMYFNHRLLSLNSK